VIAVIVEFLRKRQNFGRAEFNAKAAALATVPLDENLASELASSWGRSALRHVNLDKERKFSNSVGT
jgi:hypothetical protein